MTSVEIERRLAAIEQRQSETLELLRRAVERHNLPTLDAVKEVEIGELAKEIHFNGWPARKRGGGRK